MLITAGSFKLGFPGSIKPSKQHNNMGNAPSSASGSQAASTPPSGLPAGSNAAAGGSTSAASTPVGVPRSSSQPIRAGGSGGLASTSAPPSSSSAFHSGLTPPAAPPSPAPPGTPLLMPYAGHLSPQNPHALALPQAKDYSKTVVTKLILDERLAPFYRGLEDIEDDWTEDRVGELLAEIRDKDYEEDVPNSVTMRMKDERLGAGHSGVGGSVAKKIGIHKSREAKIAEEKEERSRREKKAYINATECPICFLVGIQDYSLHPWLTTTELSTEHQHLSLLPAAYLHGMLCPDQAWRADHHPSRVRTRMLPLLRRNRLWRHLRTPASAGTRCVQPVRPVRQPRARDVGVQPGAQYWQ